METRLILGSVIEILVQQLWETWRIEAIPLNACSVWGATLCEVFGRGSEMRGTDLESEWCVSFCGFVRVGKRDL